MDAQIRKQLPRTSLLKFEWSWRYRYFAKFRLANAVRLQVWWLTIILRAPWLEGPARAYYPHLFAAEQQGGGQT